MVNSSLLFFLIASAASVVVLVESFVVPSIASSRTSSTSRPQIRPAAPAAAAVLLFSTALPNPNELDDGHILLNRARECAFGNDQVLALEAPLFLRKLLELASDCSSGKRLGEDVCTINDDSMVELVAQLRVKAELASSIRQQYLVANMGMIAAMAGMILASSMWLQSSWHDANNGGAIPLTVQEFMWATRDGYLDAMMLHWLRHGGL